MDFWKSKTTTKRKTRSLKEIQTCSATLPSSLIKKDFLCNIHNNELKTFFTVFDKWWMLILKKYWICWNNKENKLLYRRNKRTVHNTITFCISLHEKQYTTHDLQSLLNINVLCVPAIIIYYNIWIHAPIQQLFMLAQAHHKAT